MLETLLVRCRTEKKYRAGKDFRWKGEWKGRREKWATDALMRLTQG